VVRHAHSSSIAVLPSTPLTLPPLTAPPVCCAGGVCHTSHGGPTTHRTSRGLHFWEVVPLDVLLGQLGAEGGWGASGGAPQRPGSATHSAGGSMTAQKLHQLLVPTYFPGPEEGMVRAVPCGVALRGAALRRSALRLPCICRAEAGACAGAAGQHSHPTTCLRALRCLPPPPPSPAHTHTHTHHMHAHTCPQARVAVLLRDHAAAGQAFCRLLVAPFMHYIEGGKGAWPRVLCCRGGWCACARSRGACGVCAGSATPFAGSGE
jgi:hypothetical protein